MVKICRQVIMTSLFNRTSKSSSQSSYATAVEKIELEEVERPTQIQEENVEENTPISPQQNNVEQSNWLCRILKAPEHQIKVSFAIITSLLAFIITVILLMVFLQPGPTRSTTITPINPTVVADIDGATLTMTTTDSTQITLDTFPCAYNHEYSKVVHNGDLSKDLKCYYGDTLLIQKPANYGPLDFNKNWDEYKKGFGDVNGIYRYWLGLHAIHLITKRWKCDLNIELYFSDHDKQTSTQQYTNVTVGSEDTNYTLQYETWESDRDDLENGMAGANGKQFSTKDRDNDDDNRTSLAEDRRSGWWHTKESRTDLNGHVTENGKNYSYWGDKLTMYYSNIRLSNCVERYK